MNIDAQIQKKIEELKNTNQALLEKVSVYVDGMLAALKAR